MLFYVLLCAVAIPTDALKFLAKNWRPPNLPPSVPGFKFTYLGVSLEISCLTDNIDANVDLYVSTGGNTRTNVIQNFASRVTIKNQTFLLNDIKLQDEGKYICAANVNGSDVIEMTKGRLMVRNVRANLIPEIYPDTETIEVAKTNTLMITCRTLGDYYGKPSLTWYHKGEQDSGAVKVHTSNVESNREVIGGRTVDTEKLVVKNFSNEDVGEYVCRRKVGNNLATYKKIKVLLQADVAPVITVSASNLKPSENESIVLRCDVTGTPKPEAFWTTKDGSVFKCEDRYGPCLYKIPHVQYPKNDGKFTCTAVNLAGKDVKTITLQVQVPITLSKHYRKTVLARSNEGVELYADILRGNPPPHITWYQSKCTSKWDCGLQESSWERVDNQYPNNETMTRTSSIITPKTSSDYWYRYVATNPSGTESFTFKVIRKDNQLQQFAILPDVKTGELNLGENLLVKCVVDTDVYEDVQFRKDGNDIKYMELDEGRSKVLVLRKEKAEVSDSGSYECLAQSRRSDANYRTKTLRVMVRAKTVSVVGKSKETSKELFGQEVVEKLQAKIERLTKELNELRQLMKNHLVYYPTTAGRKMPRQYYEKYDAWFVGIGTGLNSIGNDASEDVTSKFESLTDCLRHCKKKQSEHSKINGVQYCPDGGECKCEQDYVTHNSNGDDIMHYKLM